MIIIKQAALLQEFIQRQTASGKQIGFIPTMGALHPGHLNLVRISGQKCDITVCSIFVNPTQFNDPGDFTKYPQRIEKDIFLLEKSTADVLFIPSVKEVYPDGLDKLENYDLGALEQLMEGKFRPGHFQGVCQVMNRLLRMVRPAMVFMGSKDYQQCLVVSKMLESLDFKVILERCPTVRETDGLAMSSRNLRLTAGQRATAPFIYQLLINAAIAITPGNNGPVLAAAIRKLSLQFKPDYVELADARTLEPVQVWDGITPLVLLVAAYLGDVRLIDNVQIPSIPGKTEY